MFHRVLISIDGVDRHKVEFGAAYCFDWHCFVGFVVCWGCCCFGGGMRDIAVRGDTNLLTRAYPQQIVRQAYSRAYRTRSNTNRL